MIPTVHYLPCAQRDSARSGQLLTHFQQERQPLATIRPIFSKYQMPSRIGIEPLPAAQRAVVPLLAVCAAEPLAQPFHAAFSAAPELVEAAQGWRRPPTRPCQISLTRSQFRGSQPPQADGSSPPRRQRTTHHLALARVTPFPMSSVPCLVAAGKSTSQTKSIHCSMLRPTLVVRNLSPTYFL